MTRRQILLVAFVLAYPAAFFASSGLTYLICAIYWKWTHR